jgi:hypothetical protein
VRPPDDPAVLDVLDGWMARRPALEARLRGLGVDLSDYLYANLLALVDRMEHLEEVLAMATDVLERLTERLEEMERRMGERTRGRTEGGDDARP